MAKDGTSSGKPARMSACRRDLNFRNCRPLLIRPSLTIVRSERRIAPPATLPTLLTVLPQKGACNIYHTNTPPYIRFRIRRFAKLDEFLYIVEIDFVVLGIANRDCQ